MSIEDTAQAPINKSSKSLPIECVPSHIILSRKGWDAKAGGSPSPILPDGRLVSLPIPDHDSQITYADLYLPDGRKLMGKMVEQLSKGSIKADKHVHLDPDIRENALKRGSFRAAFGQCGGAQTHLSNQHVLLDGAGANNDLFLFFGRYREVEEQTEHWHYCRGVRDLQLIFGWLQVEDIIPLSEGYPEWAKSHPEWADSHPEWAKTHPHCVPSGIVRTELKKRKVKNNTLYVARQELSFMSKPGAGVFPHFDVNGGDPKLLTHQGSSASRWQLPLFFHRDAELKRFSNIGKKTTWTRDGDSWLVQRRGPGQEFVLETKGREREALEWLKKLFATA